MSIQRPQHGGNLAWAAVLADCAPEDILDFSASINPLGPPDSVLAAIQDNLARLKAYPEPCALQLRTRLSQLHNVSEDWVVVGNGAAELLTWAGRSLSQCRRTHILVPAFSDYGRALNAFDAQIEGHTLQASLNAGEGRQSAKALRELWVNPTAANDGVLLNNPHNPTGLIFRRAHLLEGIQRYGLVVLDEAFMEFMADETPWSLIPDIETHANLVIVRSLTKFFSIPGLRLGYAIAHPDRIAQWQSWRDPWSVNALAIAAGEAALADQVFQIKTHQWLQRERPWFHQSLATIPGLVPLPSRVNFVLVRCATSVVALQEGLLKTHRILIRDCISFPELGDRYFRVAIRTRPENERLMAALRDYGQLMNP